MKTFIFTIFLPSLILFVFTGCNTPENSGTHYQPSSSPELSKSYIVGIHPYLNSKKMYSAYQPILEYIENRIPGSHFKLETSKDYADYEQKLYQGRFDFALPNPYQTVNSFQHHYIAIARMKPDEVFRGIIVARKEHQIRDIRQLQGKSISFPAETALAATMMPKYYLHREGINVEKEMSVRYVGSQYSSIMNAYTGDVLVAATWPPPWESWKKENPDKAAQMEFIWATPHLVNNGVVVRTDIDPELAKNVAEVLIGLDRFPEGRKLLKNAGFDGFTSADNASFDPVIAFLKKYKITIGAEK